MFGVVKKGTYGEKGSQEKCVAVKYLELHVTQEQYLKEAKINKEASESCENIVKFLGISPSSTYAIMQEFLSFDFAKVTDLGEEISTLNKLTKILDDSFDFEDFEHFAFKIVKDVANGLSHLHNLGIAHRDLKPANVLVSNAHFEESDLGEPAWHSNPLICKLADFGESRSTIMHTRAVLMNETIKKSTVRDFNRGTPIYNAPEILVESKRPESLTQNMLLNADVWSFGLLVFSVLNPNYAFPYQKELNAAMLGRPQTAHKEHLIEILQQEEYPSWSEKYKELHEGQWKSLVKIQKLCANFGERPNMSQVMNLLETKTNDVRDFKA